MDAGKGRIPIFFSARICYNPAGTILIYLDVDRCCLQLIFARMRNHRQIAALYKYDLPPLTFLPRRGGGEGGGRERERIKPQTRSEFTTASEKVALHVLWGARCS